MLVLTSHDVDHGLKFKDLNITIDAKKGQTSEVTLYANADGDFHRAVFSLLRNGTRIDEDGPACDGIRACSPLTK